MTPAFSQIPALFAAALDWKSILGCRMLWALLVGGLGLWLAIPRRARYGKTLGGVLGLVSLGLLAADLPGVGDLTTQFIFWLMASIALIAAVATITSQSPVYSAIWFALSLLGTAGLFFLNGAQFLGVATIVVYAGAIVVTFLFVLMLAQPEGHSNYDRISWGLLPRTVSVIAAATMVAVLTFTLGGLKAKALEQAERMSASTEPSPSDREPVQAPNELLQPEHMARLGGYLFSRHLVSVEVAGTLLLAALVGAVAIAIQGKPRLENRIEEALR